VNVSQIGVKRRGSRDGAHRSSPPAQPASGRIPHRDSDKPAGFTAGPSLDGQDTEMPVSSSAKDVCRVEFSAPVNLTVIVWPA
jgi:hypothetical protein